MSDPNTNVLTPNWPGLDPTFGANESVPHPALPALRLFGARLSSNDAAGLADIENFLGKPIESLTAFAETNAAVGSWADSLAATRDEIAKLKPLNRPIYFAFPICGGPGSGPVETLRGDHDETIRQMFRDIIVCNRPFVDPKTGKVYFPIRLAWENTIYAAYFWGRAYLAPREFRALWRYIAKIGKSVDSRFYFDFTPNNRIPGPDGKVIDPRPYFPGRDLVSAIGVDAYIRYEVEVTVEGLTPEQSIAKTWDGEWGIMDLYRWAESLDLPINIAETGTNGSQDANNSVTGDRYAPHYNRLGHFVRTKRVFVASIWNKDNSPTSFNCRITDLKYPLSAAVVKAAFGVNAVPWTPALHFGLDLVQHHSAMDAALMTIDGTTQQVAAWPDRISGKVLTAAGSARPVYSATARNGKPGITADGADDAMVQTDVSNLPIYSKAVTNFVQAYTFGDAGAFSYLFADTDAVGGATNTRGINHNNGNGRFYSGGMTLTGPAIRGIDASIIATLRDGYSATQQTVQMAVNGGMLWSDGLIAQIPPTTATKRVLFGNGAANDGVANRIHATMQEMGTIRRAIDKDEVALLQGYLAWTWGTQAQLPATHPYKLAAPTYGGPR